MISAHAVFNAMVVLIEEGGGGLDSAKSAEFPKSYVVYCQVVWMKFLESFLLQCNIWNLLQQPKWKKSSTCEHNL